MSNIIIDPEKKNVTLLTSDDKQYIVPLNKIRCIKGLPIIAVSTHRIKSDTPNSDGFALLNQDAYSIDFFYKQNVNIVSVRIIAPTAEIDKLSELSGVPITN